jgi:hemin uptake protein HemP
MKPDTNKKMAPPNYRPRKIIDAGELLDGLREVRLRFGDEEYRLSITRNQKLILTK